MVTEWTEIFLVLVLETEVKRVTHAILYKFDIPKSPKINTLWEPFCHFLLEYHNLTRPMELERGKIKTK